MTTNDSFNIFIFRLRPGATPGTSAAGGLPWDERRLTQVRNIAITFSTNIIMI